jgi:hypothetical protein
MTQQNLVDVFQTITIIGLMVVVAALVFKCCCK